MRATGANVTVFAKIRSSPPRHTAGQRPESRVEISVLRHRRSERTFPLDVSLFHCTGVAEQTKLNRTGKFLRWRRCMSDRKSTSGVARRWDDVRGGVNLNLGETTFRCTAEFSEGGGSESDDSVGRTPYQDPCGDGPENVDSRRSSFMHRESERRSRRSVRAFRTSGVADETTFSRTGDFLSEGRERKAMNPNRGLERAGVGVSRWQLSRFGMGAVRTRSRPAWTPGLRVRPLDHRPRPVNGARCRGGVSLHGGGCARGGNVEPGFKRRDPSE